MLTGGHLSPMWKSIEINSRIEEHEKVEKEILKALCDASCDEHKMFSVKLALEEAVVNAIQHGNKHDPTKKIKISYMLKNGTLNISVEDEGCGFDPAEVPNCTEDQRLELPHGRGIFLMRSFMDSVYYNQRGNRVTMTKDIA